LGCAHAYNPGMAPFINGLAIGIALGLLVFVLIVGLRLLLMVLRLS